MDYRRRSAVDDVRSRRWVADDDRYPWEVDEDRCRRRSAIEEDRRRRRRAVDDRHQRRWEVDDYPPLDLPLKWRDPPPEYPPLELSLKWRNPLPDHLIRNQPATFVRSSPPLRPHSVANYFTSASSCSHDHNPASSRDHTQDPDSLLQDFTAVTPPFPVAHNPAVPTSASPIPQTFSHCRNVTDLDFDGNQIRDFQQLQRALTEPVNLFFRARAPAYSFPDVPASAHISRSIAPFDKIDLMKPSASNIECNSEDQTEKSEAHADSNAYIDDDEGCAICSSLDLLNCETDADRVLTPEEHTSLTSSLCSPNPIPFKAFPFRIIQEKPTVQKSAPDLGYTIKAMTKSLLPVLEAMFDKTLNTFDSYKDVLKDGFPLPDVPQLQTLMQALPLEMLKSILTPTTGHRSFLKFPMQLIKHHDKWIWKIDEEFFVGSGIANLFPAGVKMPGLNSSDKADPTQRFQAVRRNVAKGSELNLKRLEEVVQKLDKVPAEVSPFLHLLKCTMQEQQREFYIARETGSLPRNDLIGRGKDKEFVMQRLMKPLIEHSVIGGYRNISLLSIEGHVGMGKTTLLQHAYKEEMTEKIGLKLWICVSNDEGNDGFLHTTCGAPNYVAPEVLNDRDYNGDSAELLFCGVILLAEYLPFYDDNIINLYKKIGTGDFTFPSWLSYDAKTLISRILGHNPLMRITISRILKDEWFRKGYKPPIFDKKYEINLDDIDAAFNDSHVSHIVKKEQLELLNAFELIALSKGLNLKSLLDIEDDKTKWENELASLSSGSLGSKILVTTQMDYADEFYVPEMLVQFNNFKVESPHVDWEKPHHVVILKPAIKIFDPGGSLFPFGRHASTESRPFCH